MFYLEKKEIKKRKTMIAKTKQFNLTKNQNLKNNYLKLIFPYFSYPKESRFVKSF